MKTYMFDDTHNNSLMNITVIEGQSPSDALKKHIGRIKVRRAKDDYEKRHCDYIVQECIVDDKGRVSYKYNAKTCWYIKD